MGRDFWRYGIKANRKGLELVCEIDPALPVLSVVVADPTAMVV